MNTVINVKMSKRLRELREKFGYTQEKLAELSGIEYKLQTQLLYRPFCLAVIFNA